ncbi:MAG: aminotransferase class I/II-fold pyridoxal phosphate-dependent enzyme [Verrucomicrobiales bacterium]|jgi:aminotransferase|nr:aminotransferase class I/II-fold pyridoxal phosphate-dependent enzyme [Verrucomicrobiales bacterium]
MSITTSSKSHVAQHVQKIPRSGIRDFFDIVQSMSDVISLSIGEPDFVTPWHIREAAIYALERGKTGYTSNLGTPSLRKQISAYIAAKHKVVYDWQTEILVAVGVSEALDIALRAILNPGDEVLYHEPCYVSYSPSVTLAYGKPVAITTKQSDNFVLRADDIRKALTPKTRALMMNFPCNPTGAVMPREELEKIAQLCIEHDLIVLSDEIYCELSYSGALPSIIEIPGMKERTIYFNGFSKAYAMTGFRIGYVCAPPVLTEAMLRVHQYAMLCAPILSQEAAAEALKNGESAMLHMRDEYRRRRNFLVHHFNKMGLTCHEPQGAFYLFPNITSTALTSREFAVRLLEEKKVAMVPGDAFGTSGEGFVRCSYATAMDQLEVAVERIADFVKSR